MAKAEGDVKMMTQISSLLNWWRDFLQSVFAKSYEVKCENKPNSPVKHDFRRCQNCGEFIAFLNPRKKMRQRCLNCHAVLIINGVYENKVKGRRYELKKTLHSKKHILFITVWFAVLFSLPFIFEYHTFVPPGFTFRGGAVLLAVILICLGLLSLSILSSFYSTLGILQLLILSFFLYGEAFLIMPKYVSFTFRWVDVPTQQEWVKQQHQKALIEFKALKGVKKLDFAIAKQKEFPGSPEWHDLVLKSFVIALEDEYEDFAVIFKRLPESFDFSQIPEVYEYYGKYLQGLFGRSHYDFVRQCTKDPWNIMTAEAVGKYPEAFAVCEGVNKNWQPLKFYGW